jgi:Uma2 family endonuclease
MGLSAAFYNHIKKKNGKCKVYTAPFAVYLNNSDYNYLEPDISVVCDETKLDSKGCHGAPDLIVEIVSESTIQNDYMRKMFKYRDSGVREYWIVDPLKKMVRTYDFENELTGDYLFTEEIQVGIYKELNIRVSDYLT